MKLIDSQTNEVVMEGTELKDFAEFLDNYFWNHEDDFRYYVVI